MNNPVNRISEIPDSEKWNRLKIEFDRELEFILRYWSKHIINAEGRFVGSVNNDNIPGKNAPLGIVMMSRILWTFSAASIFGKNESEKIANKAYCYMNENFRDREFGGVFWSLNEDGTPLQTRKQVYGIAFCIYGLSEYYKLTKREEVLNWSIELFRLVEEYSFDAIHNGYVEAFMQDWKEIDDLRLSSKDQNERKSMNTHLHLVEAYANLYSVWPEATLKERIINLLNIFSDIIIDLSTGHLHLFMDDRWHIKSTTWSFGHDIEASWLLLECAEIIGSDRLIGFFKNKAISLANAAAEGLDADGGLFNEINCSNHHLNREKHWWPQSEALVGFFNAWEISNDVSWLKRFLNSWDYIQQELKDQVNGEWFWGRDISGRILNEEKAGFWKCPYHNSRACMEVIKRIKGYEIDGINV